MGKIISKIILVFITFSFLSFLIFITFFSGEKNEIQAPNFYIEKIGETKSGSLIIDKIDLFTTIYSTNKNYEFNGKNYVKLGTGSYVIDSRHSFTNFILDLGTNLITLESGGMLYIDNNEKYKKIVSFNNRVKIDFIKKRIDEKTKKEISTKTVELYLYPHMYISFNPKRFSHVKSADSLRVSQLAILKYFNFTFKDIIKDGLKFISGFENKEFLKLSLIDIIKKQKKYSQELIEIRKNNVSDIKGIDYIEKYFVIFYNDRKKSIYYKNKILKNLINLLNNKNNKTAVTYSIISDFNSLKEVNPKEFEEMKILIEKLFFLVLSNLDSNSTIVEHNFNKIITNLFHYRNFKDIDLLKDVDKYNYLGNLKYYFRLLNIQTDAKKIDPLSLEYYILFKQNILISNLANPDIPLDLYNLLLKGFVLYSNDIKRYFLNLNDKNKIIQNIIYNQGLLDVFSKSIFDRFFEKERNKQDLLVLKNDNIYNIDDLNYSVEIFFKEYKKHIGDLQRYKNKYLTLMKKYSSLEVKIKEYLSALNNYSLYEENYSKVNKALIGVDTYQEDDEKLSFESFMKYISKFSGINTSSLSVDIVNDTYYHVKNIVINNYAFSFDLYPYSGYLIRNIVLKEKNFDNTTREFIFYDNLENTSFSLENEEEKYKELFDKAKDEDKEIYDFRNFFLNKFFIKERKRKEKYVEEEIKVDKDDDVIRTFKIAKLIGNNGEFKKVRKYLKITYNDLDVKRVGGNDYSIKINKAKLNIFVETEGGVRSSYYAEFTSNYRLTSDKHYFYNIYIKPYLKDSSGELRNIFKDVEFKISGKIDLVDFNKEIYDLFKKLPEIQAKYRNEREKKEIKVIIYSIRLKKVLFR